MVMKAPNCTRALVVAASLLLASGIHAAARPKWNLNHLNSILDLGRTAHSAVFDPATKTMIVFAGAVGTTTVTSTNDVLLFSATGDWSVLIPNGAAGSPPPRYTHTAVYDSANNRMIVFGGYSFQVGGFLNDVWVLANANGQGGTPTWTQLIPSGPSPDPRWGHTAVYDPGSNRLIVFAGDNNSVTFSDVWVLRNANGLGGAPAWTRLAPTGGPPAGQADATAVYDPVNNIMIVFGGGIFQGASVRPTNALWSLSHANGLGGTPTWTNLIPDGTHGSPGKRWGHSAIYDAANNRMVIFAGGSGGQDAFPEFNDLWVLADANGIGGAPTWTRLHPAGVIPGRRGGHTAVYDPLTNRVLMYAGDSAEAKFFTVWTLTDANGL